MLEHGGAHKRGFLAAMAHIPINNETKELDIHPSHLLFRPAAIFTSDNEPPADIYIFNNINPQT